MENKKLLIERFKRDMQIRNFSPRTIATYSGKISLFLDYFSDKNIANLSLEELKVYMFYLIKERNNCASSIKQVIGAIKNFYVLTLNIKWAYQNLPQPKVQKHIPVILSKESVCDVINSPSNIKHQAILVLFYTSGIRMSELLSLKIIDIDSQRMQIRVLGKGNKYRYTILSEYCLKILRMYWKKYKPVNYLFNGVKKGTKYSNTSVRKILQKALKKTGITKKICIHSLRHAFATHLLETGTNIVVVKNLLGHTSLNTTMRYIHLQKHPNLEQHPFDDFFKQL